MTTTTDTAPLTDAPTLHTGRRLASGRARFAIAFVAGLAAALALGAGALYAFERQYDGRILPGIRAAGVDLSGLTPSAARDRLAAAFSSESDGKLVIEANGREIVITYATLSRRVDIDALVDEAAAIGRSGSLVDRVVGNAKTALRGIELQPRILFDQAALANRIERIAAGLDRRPKNASIAVSKDGFVLSEGRDGRLAERDGPLAEASVALTALDAPATINVTIPVATAEPNITTAEAKEGKQTAELIARDIDITVGDEKWTIKASTIRTWLRISPTVDGRYVPVINTAGPAPTLESIGAKVATAPKNASFLVGKGNQVVGVTAGRNGRDLDVEATTRALIQALQARGASQTQAAVEASVVVVRPKLTTEEAEKAAPLMARISTWTTYFPIGIKNGYGANIWLPATFINGYVLAPGEKFDFWDAVGPVTRERGFKAGGAIINGRTEPQGALAGGICSCSTTLFNAALRAGLDMGSRRNHYYYIDRYPLGLDATVFISASGSRQTMSFTNDTKYPILIRGINTRDGNRGYVRFDLYSVPTGRTVSFSRPIVKNIKNPHDTVQYTSTLPAGRRERIEFPVQGKDVWVTRTVRNAAGTVIHTETFYSHYAVITGIVLVGTGGTSPPPPASPSPSP